MRSRCAKGYFSMSITSINLVFASPEQTKSRTQSYVCMQCGIVPLNPRVAPVGRVRSREGF